jgi:O-antigen ligase
LAVETGLVGLLLLGVNLIMLAWQVMRQTSRASRLVFLWAVVLLALWLFVINILDITLFYLAIMPSGLLLLMARSPGEKTLPDLSPAVASHRIGATR